MITVRKILKHKPCYTKERLQRLIGEGITVGQMLSLRIPKCDKAWVLHNITLPTKRVKITDEFMWGCHCKNCFYMNVRYAPAKQLRRISEILDRV